MVFFFFFFLLVDFSCRRDLLPTLFPLSLGRRYPSLYRERCCIHPKFGILLGLPPLVMSLPIPERLFFWVFSIF